jgi:predicted nucleic acid-binding protein
VALAAARGLTRILSLDKHFRIYKINGRKAFVVVL